jgi:TRAP-type C4-dicarboxylate transport system permease large subunit/TRAP-type C4-dicarboxylate transport system permease small subunit
MAGSIVRRLHGAENAAADLSLYLLVLVPIVEVLARTFFTSSLPNSNEYTQHLVMVVTFLAGAVTSRRGQHLALALKLPFREPLGRIVRTAVAIFGAGLGFALAWSSLGFVLLGFESGQKIGLFPLRIVVSVMVLGYVLIAVRFVTGLEKGSPKVLGILLAMVLGSGLASSSVVRVCTVVLGHSPAVLAVLGKSVTAFVAKAATPLIFALIVSALFNMPLFAVLGGCAYLLFARQSLPLEIVPNKAYAMLTGFSIAAIPLFTLTGFLLSESRAGERLVRLFKAFFAWFPGGMAVMAILVCAFFTTFTGASGVTIVALGGLLFIILTGAGYSRRFTIGLLTASGSIGLLFPPSLPVIIYGVASRISIKEMFKGGLLPGAAFVLAMITISIVYAARNRVERQPFLFREALSGLRESIWELLLPVLIFLGYFGARPALVRRLAIPLVFVLTLELLIRKGPQDRARPAAARVGVLLATAVFVLLMIWPGPSWLRIGCAAGAAAVLRFVLTGSAPERPPLEVRLKEALSYCLMILGVLALLAVASAAALTLVESAAMAALYTLVVQVLVHRDLRIRDIPRASEKCLPIIGGTLTILALAYALSYYIIDAEIPMKLTAWVLGAISSKYVFLFLLNLVLLVVGCFMDIYSATLVVVPLIIPLGQVFHIHPVHLGIIFLANMELGYLTPPVGLNLYLSSYRFNEPIVRVYKDIQVFLAVHFATVLLITYVPFLTMAFLGK